MQPSHEARPSATTTTLAPDSLALNLAAAWLGAMSTGIAIFVLGRATETFAQHLALVLAAVSVTVLGIWFAPGDRSRTRHFAIGGVVVTLLGAMVLGGALSQPTEVNEQVVTADAVAPVAVAAGADTKMAKDDGVMSRSAGAGAGTAARADAAPSQNLLLASGEFEALEHRGEGTASLIRTTDGRTVLTLTGFSTDAGPDLDVRLVGGDPTSDADVEAGRSIRLGKLKGTSGDQQYVLPEGVDPAEFTHVYVWCRAFSVGFTRAQLS